MTPKGLLCDYGGTLVEEVSVDLQSGADLAVTSWSDLATAVNNRLSVSY